MSSSYNQLIFKYNQLLFLIQNQSGTSALLNGDNVFTGTNEFTQIPTTATATAGDNSSKVATTEYVDTAISVIPDLLSTDNTFTGTNEFTQIPTTATATAGDNSSKVSTTEYVDTAISVIPDLLSTDNTFTGTNDFTEQVSFSLPPNSAPPTLGNDLATKGYVDSLVGQYSGGLNLFLNYSQPVTVGGNDYFSISKQVSSASQQSITVSTIVGDNLLISFISNELNILEIPAGLFDLFLYGAVSSPSQIVFYRFVLKKYSGGVITTIASSGNSKDVNATPSSNPEVYLMNATVSLPEPMLLTDRIIIEIYYDKTAGTSVDLTTYFENAYYSFVQSTLNAGTKLLTSDNNWTGNNNFELSPTVPTVTAGDASTKVASTDFVTTAISNIVYPFVGTADSDLNMNGFNITSPSAITIGNLDINTNLEGVVNVTNDLIVGSGASTVRLFGGDGGDTFDTTTQNDIQLRLAGRNRNQIYNAVIPITTTALGTIILPTALNGYYVYIINGSNFDWFIKPQVGEFIGQGLGGSGVGNPSSGIIIRAFQTFGFVQLVSGVSYNLIVNEAINGTQPTFGSIFCNVYEGRNPSAVVPFATAVGSGVRIGRATFPSTIQGFVKLPNLAVSNYTFRRNNVVQAIPSGADTVVLFPSLITSSTASSLTYSAGIFTNNTTTNIMCQITYSVGFGANSSGIRTTKIICSTYGVSGGIQTPPLPSNITTLNGSVILSIPAGITFNLTAFQSSGASINLDLNLTSIQILVL